MTVYLQEAAMKFSLKIKAIIMIAMIVLMISAVSIISVRKGITDTANFGIAMVDMNGLKELNDRYGHEKGDLGIQALCSRVCGVFKHSPVFRFGAHVAPRRRTILRCEYKRLHGNAIPAACRISTARRHRSFSLATLFNPGGTGAQFGRLWCTGVAVYSNDHEKRPQRMDLTNAISA